VHKQCYHLPAIFARPGTPILAPKDDFVNANRGSVAIAFQDNVVPAVCHDYGGLEYFGIPEADVYSQFLASPWLQNPDKGT